MDTPINERDKYALTYEEFQYIRGFVDFWTKMGHGELKKFSSLEETKTNYTMWTLKFLKQKYPSTKFKELEYRDSVLKLFESKGAEPVYDTIAFKFKPNRPELYLLLQEIPVLLDEYRYDAYEQGPFVRPNWDELKNID